MTTLQEKKLDLLKFAYHQLCPACESNHLELIASEKKDGMDFGGEMLFKNCIIFRMNCRDCRAQFIPDRVNVIGGFGVI